MQGSNKGLLLKVTNGQLQVAKLQAAKFQVAKFAKLQVAKLQSCIVAKLTPQNNKVTNTQTDKQSDIVIS